ncbi:transferase hexapeptide domain protein [Talaromyces stipitatus ATCC 10500]|uniref:Dynactin subunit 6 n=1 Tax=Talaromyces stipitatus (strain ATCC 10500 / CBS 375.48 / QM 6759 / NRRL 1006) TaxID=441959 RepID=B8MAI7_TALSN|nr:transferase hexapeptide domain protein [Talaromyces stipitatus ATCC 10500]EED17411.1 transferase hexapeptide domain protein [Talaromyces stipitatus ATCC 10500]
MASTSSSTYLKPPPSASTSTQRQRVSSSSASGPAPPPRAPVSVHSTTTVSETTAFHGTYPITIGSGTVIHPRVRIQAFEGPVQIGDGCIIGEKTIIGDIKESTSAPTSTSDGILTRISSSVVIGPQTTIRTGAYIRSAAVVDSLATINRHATIGSHSKICSQCEISEGTVVEDWMVIWAAGTGSIGQRKRRRFVGPAAEEHGGHRPNAKRIEDARLLVLHKEREGLAKMISLSTSGGSKRSATPNNAHIPYV